MTLSNYHDVLCHITVSPLILEAIGLIIQLLPEVPPDTIQALKLFLHGRNIVTKKDLYYIKAVDLKLYLSSQQASKLQSAWTDLAGENEQKIRKIYFHDGLR